MNGRDLESPTLSHNHVQHMRNDSQQVQDNEPRDTESEGFVPLRSECMCYRKLICLIYIHTFLSL